MGREVCQSYKLKATTGKFNICKDKYTQDLIEFVKEKIQTISITSATPTIALLSRSFVPNKTEQSPKNKGLF
jgi:hypothetical protein